MPTKIFIVTINLSLADGKTWEDADLDGPDSVREYRIAVVADSADYAEDAALDAFHSSVAIGVLDYVEVTIQKVEEYQS